MDSKYVLTFLFYLLETTSKNGQRIPSFSSILTSFASLALIKHPFLNSPKRAVEKSGYRKATPGPEINQISVLKRNWIYVSNRVNITQLHTNYPSSRPANPAQEKNVNHGIRLRLLSQVWLKCLST